MKFREKVLKKGIAWMLAGVLSAVILAGCGEGQQKEQGLQELL